MKKLFCMMLVVILNLSMVPLPVLAQSPGTMVAGLVSTSQGRPVSGIKISAKDPAARVISEAVTDARGRYALRNLAPHRYQLTLDPVNSPYKGQSVVSAVGKEGLTVNWMVSQATGALAMATPGTGDPDSTGTGATGAGTTGTGAAGLGSGATAGLIFLGGSGLLAGTVAGLHNNNNNNGGNNNNNGGSPSL